MRNTVFLTAAEAARLRELAVASRTAPELRRSLHAVLDRAEIRPAQALPTAVVCLHAPFLCIEVRHREHFHWRIVYPEQADFGRGRLSVLSPAGLALLGTPAGRPVRLPVEGDGQALELLVEEVLPG